MNQLTKSWENDLSHHTERYQSNLGVNKIKMVYNMYKYKLKTRQLLDASLENHITQFSGEVELYTCALSNLCLLSWGSVETFGRDPCQVHGELAAELSELTPEGVEGLQILARMGLVLDNVEHVASLILSLSYCWIITLCV